MKVGDKVELGFNQWSKGTSWIPGWTLEFISGDWGLIKKESDWQYPMSHPDCPPKSIVRRKVALAMLRIEVSVPESCSSRPPLPNVGDGVMFKVPNVMFDRWEFGLVVKQNKKSIKVLHDNRFINRNFDQFIEVPSEDR